MERTKHWDTRESNIDPDTGKRKYSFKEQAANRALQERKKLERNNLLKVEFPVPVSDHIIKPNPAKYRGKHEESMPNEVARLARFGLTNEEIAEFYNISLQTFKTYYRDIQEFRDALEEGRMLSSMRVVDSLHKQAVGYKVKEVEIAEHVMRDGTVVQLKKVTKKYIQPSATAAIYLLKTRHGDKWMDVMRTEQHQNLNITVKNVDFSDMTTEELLTLKKLGINKLPPEYTGHGSNQLMTIQ